MPLSFVLITAIASASGLALIAKDKESTFERRLLHICILLNLFILVAGLYLAQTQRLEPLWITKLSIVIAFVTLNTYAFAKYNILHANLTENRPQLF